jgi:hypothetical protein
VSARGTSSRLRAGRGRLGVADLYPQVRGWTRASCPVVDADVDVDVDVDVIAPADALAGLNATEYGCLPCAKAWTLTKSTTAKATARKGLFHPAALRVQRASFGRRSEGACR